MDFDEVVRQRRMVRRYDPHRPISRETVDELVALAVQAPSAGFSQGWGFLVLDDRAEVDRYWEVTAPDGPADSWLEGMRTAPVVLLALSDPEAYARRYARPDKTASTLAVGLGAAGPVADLVDWPVPWWDVDTGMAVLLVLLGATDRGLGACLAGVPATRWDAVRAAFGVPAHLRPVGLVTLGHPAPGAAGGRGRARRPLGELVRRGRWTDPPGG